jgi:hypothetical protein
MHNTVPNPKGPMTRAAQQLPHVPAQKAVEVALQMIDVVQHESPGAQVAGAALLLQIMTSQLGLNVSELMNQAQRRYDAADTFRSREAQALTDYVNGEFVR